MSHRAGRPWIPVLVTALLVIACATTPDTTDRSFTIAMIPEKPAPTVPATTAKVVTQPSIPPRTASPR